MKRAEIPMQSKTKTKRSKIKSAFPIASSPGNRCGVTPSSIAMPPVDMGKVNHAHVKCFIRCLNVIWSLASWMVSFIPVYLLDTAVCKLCPTDAVLCFSSASDEFEERPEDDCESVRQAACS